MIGERTVVAVTHASLLTCPSYVIGTDVGLRVLVDVPWKKYAQESFREFLFSSLTLLINIIYLLTLIFISDIRLARLRGSD